MIGYDALRAEQARARARGPAARDRARACTSSRRASADGQHVERGRRREHRRQRSGAGADEQRQPRPEPGDDDRPGRRRPPRRRRRRRHGRPGRHRVGAVRPGHRREPQRGDPERRRGRRPPSGCATKLLEIAAHRLEAAPEDLEIEAGRISVAGTPARVDDDRRGRPARLPQPGRAPARAWRWASRRRPATRRTPRSRGRTRATPASARSIRAPGGVTLLRYVVSEDCGVMINPDVVEGQIAGGVVQGIGGVLYEHMVYDDARQPAEHDVRRLPPAHRGRGADDRVRPHRDPGVDEPRRLQGDGRGRRDRLAAGGHQRRRRRRRPPRRAA